MPRHEGFVATLEGEYRAEVIIQPGSMGVPGTSPQINRRVCHCATDGSTITIEALNKVGASVGDWVSISRNATEMIKNAALLLGIPIIGLITGIILAAFLTDGFSLRLTGGIIAMATCLFSGIAIGVLIFRRVSTGNQPVIEHIIEKRRHGDSLFSDNQCFSDKSNRGCDTCAGPFSPSAGA